MTLLDLQEKYTERHSEVTEIVERDNYQCQLSDILEILTELLEDLDETIELESYIR